MKTLAAKEPKHHIVSGFPGIGKSTFAEKYGNKVSDSDSSKFDKAEFPTNYMRHIVEQAKTKDWVMVSSHDVVRKALVELKLPGTTVNFEGIAAESRNGRTRLYILSDDNFNPAQRTLLLGFDVD